MANVVEKYFENLNDLVKNLSNDDYSFSDHDTEDVYALGYYLFTSGKYTAAEEVFRGLTDRYPYKSHYWRALGAVNQQLERYEEAIENYTRAIDNDPNDVVSLVYRGESAVLAGNEKEGVADFRRVLEKAHEGILPEYEPWVKRASLLLKLRGQVREEKK